MSGAVQSGFVGRCHRVSQRGGVWWQDNGQLFHEHNKVLYSDESPQDHHRPVNTSWISKVDQCDHVTRAELPATTYRKGIKSRPSCDSSRYTHTELIQGCGGLSFCKEMLLSVLMRQTLHHLHHHNSTLLVKQAKTSLPLTATTGVTGNTADLTVSVCVSVPAAVSGAKGGG